MADFSNQSAETTSPRAARDRISRHRGLRQTRLHHIPPKRPRTAAIVVNAPPMLSSASANCRNSPDSHHSPSRDSHATSVRTCGRSQRMDRRNPDQSMRIYRAILDQKQVSPADSSAECPSSADPRTPRRKLDSLPRKLRANQLEHQRKLAIGCAVPRH